MDTRMSTAPEYYSYTAVASSGVCQCPVHIIDPLFRPAYAWLLLSMPLLLLIYALNTAYLAAFASPTLFYYTNVVFHIVAGVGLTVLGAIRLVQWRRSSSGRVSSRAAIFASIAA